MGWIRMLFGGPQNPEQPDVVVMAIKDMYRAVIIVKNGAKSHRLQGDVEVDSFIVNYVPQEFMMRFLDGFAVDVKIPQHLARAWELI